MAGKHDGFLLYKRENASAEPANERIQHFHEFYQLEDAKQLHEQSARCMDCGVPFCHYRCPLDNNIPDFNKAVFEDRWEDAFHILEKTNPFPEFTGRVCPAPCEQGCVLGINNDAVTIEEIEKNIAETAFQQAYVQPFLPETRNGKKIAVIGSGPAGMAAAHYLNGFGFEVTVFEKDKFPGGLLRYGIPDFKLEKNVVERRVKLMETAGIKFRTKTEIGKDVSTDQLEQLFDAIVLTVGSQTPRNYTSDIKGVKGAYFAMEYLREANQFVSGENTNRAIDVKGKHVVVIGGGDTGSDCIGTANRDGAASITELDYHEKPPLSRTDKTPWPNDALMFHESTSHKEGCERIFKHFATEFITDENQQLKALMITEVQIGRDAEGNRIVELIEGTSREIPCDILLLAIGFTGIENEAYFGELGLNKRSFYDKNYQTISSRYFYAGDARTGQSLVVNAIAEGREVAKRVKEMFR